MKEAFINATVLNGRKDMKAMTKQTILVDDGVITYVGDEQKVDGYKVYDLMGKYVMPGLINAHVHLPAGGKPTKKKTDPVKLVKFILKNNLTKKIGVKMCQDFATTELLSGVTTIRSAGGVADFDTIVRDNINSGKKLGPRLLACNNAIAPLNGHMAGTVSIAMDNIDDALKMIDRLNSEKVDWIKLMITGGVLDAKCKGEPGALKMDPKMVKACCDKAHKLGYRVEAHVESSEGVRVALENGVDTIEHGSILDDHMIDLFKKRNACYICTISPALPLAKFDPKYTQADDVVIYNSNLVFENIVKGAKAALENGIKVGLGTDTGCPYITHYNMWRELEYFCKYCGVSKTFSLYSATLNNAEILGIDKETGSIEKGKSCDLLITNENPLDGFKTIANPYMVVYKGNVIKEPKIKKYPLCDELLDKYM